MEKKIEVITESGKTVRVIPHMLEDMARFGATQVRKILKETPKELIKVPVRPTEVLPEMKITNPVVRPAEVVPPVRTTPVSPKNTVVKKAKK